MNADSQIMALPTQKKRMFEKMGRECPEGRGSLKNRVILKMGYTKYNLGLKKVQYEFKPGLNIKGFFPYRFLVYI